MQTKIGSLQENGVGVGRGCGTGMPIAAWFGQPHERQEGGGGDADVPAHAFPFETDVPALPPRSSLCRSTSKERSLVVGLLINFPVTVV